MSNHLLKIFWLTISLIYATITIADTLTATVDKTEITAGETFTLTISTDLSDKPDLSVLEASFYILGLTSSSQSGYDLHTGQTTFSNNWVLHLKPNKQTGDSITVPSLSLGSQKTTPITIKIVTAPQISTTIDGTEFLKVEISVAETTIYPQQNIELLLQVYASDDVLRANSLSVPKIENANFKLLSDSNRSVEIKGKPYTIAERRYMLSPQKSGDLIIKPFAVSALVQEGKRTVTKVATSNELTLKVKPKPTDYPANAPWLPVKNLTIETKWDKSLIDVTQGDSLTRTLTITAKGLTSNQIGQIITPKVSGIRSYIDQPTFKDTINQNLPVGIREDKELFIPTQVGEITIPETKIAWWNVEKDKLEYAIIPEQKIIAKANPAFNQIPTTGSVTVPTTTLTNNQPAPQTIIQQVESPTLWWWKLSTAFFVGTTLLGFGLWLYARSQPAILRKEKMVIDPRILLNAIKNACFADDPHAARLALDNWIKQQPENITEIVSRHKPLAEALDKLNATLYSRNKNTWSGASLWEAIRSLPDKETARSQANNVLPPFYPK